MTTPNRKQQPLPATDHEYLDLEQAAILCSVSTERFVRWIDKGNIPVVEHQGRQLIHCHDLIQHLVRHNIPIPDRLLAGNAKKILLVLVDETVPRTLTNEVIWALYRLKKEQAHIVDFVRFDTTLELKIITFRPDLIILLQQDETAGEAQQAIRRMVNGTTPVRLIAPGRPLDLDALLTP